MSALVISALDQAAPARRLADKLGAPFAELEIHRFPDGESLVRASQASATTIIYDSLDRPNGKLIELMLAASALRDLGAARLVLVAPYLCYMRQDKAFEPGQAISQRVIGRLLAERFDRIVSISPHLHRVSSLDTVFPGAETTSLSAAPLLAKLIQADGDPADVLIVGPDSESRPSAEAVARELSAPFVVLSKVRESDRNVSSKLDEKWLAPGRAAYIVDDVASTGNTIAAAASVLKAAGASRIEAAVAHALLSGKDLRRLRAAGVERLRSTDSVLHPTNAIESAPLLAGALRGEIE
ncbi:MAG: ribose-phosphate diphosphokinase [Alphaproteobacteria bacterium]|nr:ribose-phosphate diphosphokinase [Alphaproteobacteria bacterium]